MNSNTKQNKQQTTKSTAKSTSKPTAKSTTKSKVTLNNVTLTKIRTPEEDNAIFTNITNTLKEKVKNIALKPNTIHLVIKYVMELVEETPLKGIEQKELSLKVLKELFKDLTEGDDEIILLKLIDDGTIGNMIDLIVDATHGKLNVNALIETSSSCILTCIPYIMGSKTKQKLKQK
tara:strand:+ start:140 stop:667 length:528 start_codon:yes stop_codon:yes gene_type:complete